MRGVASHRERQNLCRRLTFSPDLRQVQQLVYLQRPAQLPARVDGQQHKVQVGRTTVDDHADAGRPAQHVVRRPPPVAKLLAMDGPHTPDGALHWARTLSQQ